MNIRNLLDMEKPRNRRMKDMDEFTRKIDELIIILKEHTKKMDKMMHTIEQILYKLIDHEKRISALEKSVFK